MFYKKITKIKEVVHRAKSENKIISLIPTMGCLHEGHLQLVKEARRKSDFIIVSIFVNKKQFNKNDDYQKYPRNINSDIKKLEDIGVDAIFIPDDEEIYQIQSFFSIKIDAIDKILCGKDRDNHFNAVALIIIKLFNIIHLPHQN